MANGFVAEVEDRGIGISPEDVVTYNQLLAQAPEFDLADSNQLGLFVVARLAAKHRVNVTLRRSPYGGTSAIVLLPNSIVAAADRAGAGSLGALHAELAPGAAAALTGPFPGLSLVGSERSFTNGTGTSPAIGGPPDTGALPIGATPIGAIPNGPVPNGPVPNGTAPYGGVSNRVADSAAAGSGAANRGAASGGAASGGAANSGAANSRGGYDRIQYGAPAQSPSGGWVGDVVQAEVSARSDVPLRPSASGSPPWPPSVSGSPPWPPAEPVPDDFGQSQRGGSPWFQSRHQDPPSDVPPAAGPPITGRPLTSPSAGRPGAGADAGPGAGQPAALPRRRTGTYDQPPQARPDQAQSAFAPPGFSQPEYGQSGYAQAPPACGRAGSARARTASAGPAAVGVGHRDDTGADADAARAVRARAACTVRVDPAVRAVRVALAVRFVRARHAVRAARPVCPAGRVRLGPRAVAAPAAAGEPGPAAARQRTGADRGAAGRVRRTEPGRHARAGRVAAARLRPGPDDPGRRGRALAERRPVVAQ